MRRVDLLNEFPFTFTEEATVQVYLIEEKKITLYEES